MAKTGYTTQQLTVLQFGDFAEQQRKIMAGVHAGQANIKAERESQKALQDKENKWVVDQYARVGELPEIGSATFDQNKDDFFNDQIDKYIKIKNGIDNGSVTADVGGRALAKINDQVKAFQSAAPEVLAQAKIIQEGMKIPYGEPGSISAVNPTVQQKILLDLIQGGDVRIVDNEGELILFQPAGVDSDGNKTEGGMINVNELINLEASGTEYVRKVPDLTNSLKTAFTGVVGEEGKWNWSKNKDNFMTIETIEDGDQKITTKTMTTDQRENIFEAIITSKGIEPIINNERYMESVWVDMMANIEGVEGEWNPGDADKVFKAKEFLANKAIDDNAEEVGIKHIMSTRSKQGDGGDSSKAYLKNLPLKEKNKYVSSNLRTDKDILSFLLKTTGETFTIEEEMEEEKDENGNVKKDQDGNIIWKSTGHQYIADSDEKNTGLTRIYNTRFDEYTGDGKEIKGWESDSNIAAIIDRYLKEKYYKSQTAGGGTSKGSDPAGLGI